MPRASVSNDYVDYEISLPPGSRPVIVDFKLALYSGTDLDDGPKYPESTAEWSDVEYSWKLWLVPPGCAVSLAGVDACAPIQVTQGDQGFPLETHLKSYEHHKDGACTRPDGIRTQKDGPLFLVWKEMHRSVSMLKANEAGGVVLQLRDET